MILIICFILLLSCSIEIQFDRDYISSSWRYYLPFFNTSILSITRDYEDFNLYYVSILIDFGYIEYNDRFFNFELEKDFVFNKEYYNKYVGECI